MQERTLFPISMNYFNLFTNYVDLYKLHYFENELHKPNVSFRVTAIIMNGTRFLKRFMSVQLNKSGRNDRAVYRF